MHIYTDHRTNGNLEHSVNITADLFFSSFPNHLCSPEILTATGASEAILAVLALVTKRIMEKVSRSFYVFVFRCVCVCVFVFFVCLFFVVLFRFGHCAGASHIDLLKFVSGGGPRNHRPSHYQVRSCSLPHHVIAWLGSVVKVPEPISVCGFPFARGHSSICLSRRGVFF